MIIHSGRFSDLMNALTTFSRLIARCCFWPFDVWIVSRRTRGLVHEVEVLEQVADRLRAHAAAEVDAEAVRRPEAVLELAEDLLVVDDLLHLELAERLPGLLEPAHGVDRGLARVLAARLHVLVHLADLQRPLHERVEILLLDLPVGAQAEVVRELAEVGRRRRPARARRASSPLPSSRDFSRFFASTPATSSASSLAAARRPSSSASWIRLMCFETAPFFEPVAASCSARSGASAVADLLRRGRDGLELARREPAVVADRRVADELLDLLRSSVVILPASSANMPPTSVARLLERRHGLAPRPSWRGRATRSRRPRRSPCPCPWRSSRAGGRAAARARRAARRGRRRSRSARALDLVLELGRGRRRASRRRPR